MPWLKEELQRTNLELESYKDKIKENQEKIKLNKQLPYLVGNIVEVASYVLCLSILDVVLGIPGVRIPNIVESGGSCLLIFFKFLLRYYVVIVLHLDIGNEPRR